MTKKEARSRALALRDKWEQIVTDAFRIGYLTDGICLGCGKVDCGGCPAGTSTGWHPDLHLSNAPQQGRRSRTLPAVVGHSES